MSKSFAGKVVIITGANSGIGESAALAYLEAGATVYGIARRKDAIDAASKKHPGITWRQADVAKNPEISAVIERIAKEAGRIDVLVNNAAIFAVGPLDQLPDEAARAQFDINVHGLWFATRAALPALKASKGSILNLSSAAGHKPVPGASHYGATKAAVESFTRSWALELAPAGVRVNALAPGPTETPVFDKLGLPTEMVPQVKAQFVSQVPLARMASVEEVSRWAVTLTDPGVTWLTGQVLSVDGGMSLT